MALILQHPSYTPQLVDPMTHVYPETFESVQRAKLAQLQERTFVIAWQLANFDDVDLRAATAATVEHYQTVAKAAILAAKKGPAL